MPTTVMRFLVFVLAWVSFAILGAREARTAEARKALVIASLLLRSGAEVDPDIVCMEEPLHYAATKGHLYVVRVLVENGADINREACWGSPLLQAVRGGHLEVLRYLLANGARVNTADEVGITPLHLAASKGHADLVVELLKAGACINCICETSSECGSPLHEARKAGMTATARVLLERGARDLPPQ